MRIAFVDDGAALSQICDLAARTRWLALDTECVREKTYYPRPALVQVATGENAEEVALIDPTAVSDLAPLRRLLADGAILKIIHSAQQDYEVLERLECPVEAPVFDTQLAAAFVGLGYQVGYKQLVMACLAVGVEKDCTRSDWLQRPLSSEQTRYAVHDVIHLRSLQQFLEQRLRREGKREWFAEESRRNLEAAAERDTGDAWQKVGGRGRLTRASDQRRLRLLAQWREQKAQKADLPRRWLLGDDCLIQLALMRPAKASAIEKIAACRNRRIRTWAREIEALLARAGDDDETPSKKPGTTRLALMDELMRLVREIAAEHGIEPSLLATRRQLTQLVRPEEARANAPLLHGWRTHLLGERVAALLEKT